MKVFQELFDNYNAYHAAEITTNRFSPTNFHQVMTSLAGEYPVNLLGNSVESRPIYSINIGNGPIRILMWSQMHGNESTATRAILDILKFMNAPGELATLQESILTNLTLCLVPMLNPDGTALFQRRNALNIDINRDAQEFTAPESQILKSIINDFNPDFAFNLHDQRRFYNISGTNKPSTVAFLAPAYDASEDINPNRRQAMQLIAQMRQELETIIPGQVGIYDDSFTPRAFGDYSQRAGVSTILMESGWAKDDMEKEYVRQLNFCTLVSAFDTIAENGWTNLTIDNYLAIPKNDERLFDLLIKNIIVKRQGHEYKIDLGIQRAELSISDNSSYYSIGEVADIGDLKDWYGFDELDGEDLIVYPGLVWEQGIEEVNQMDVQQAIDLVNQGYLFVVVQQASNKLYTHLPINVVSEEFVADAEPVFEGKANFLLKSSAGILKYVVVNGFLWNLDDPLPVNINGLVL